MVSEKKPGNIRLNENSIVLNYDRNRTDPNANYVEIGYMLVQKKIMLSFYKDPNCNFSSIIQTMSNKGLVSTFIQDDLYHSISDPIRWKKTEQYLSSKKIIFLDRDGVINLKAQKGEYVTRWEDFKII